MLNKFVVTRVLSRDQWLWPVPPKNTSLSLVMRSLKDADQVARLDVFATPDAARATGGEVYEVLLAVNGPWEQAPSHVVYAIWELRDEGHATAFVESRRQLFALRQQVLPTFAADWLLKRHGRDGWYMVVGFYGDEEGASRLCREHPEIKLFAAANPASNYSAVDRSGILCWRIEAMGPGEGPHPLHN